MRARSSQDRHADRTGGLLGAAGQHWLRLLGLYLVFIPIQLAGLLCFLVGVFFTTTWMAASLNAAYRAAFDRTEKTPPAP